MNPEIRTTLRVLLSLILTLSIQTCADQDPMKITTKTAVAPTTTVSCCGPSPEEMEMIWPDLIEVNPPVLSPGSGFEITGNGGYRIWKDERGIGIDETARTFELFLDGDPFGEIQCHINHCQGKYHLLADISPGVHILSTEGGSEINFEVKVGD
jgi:hypothetical protein